MSESGSRCCLLMMPLLILFWASLAIGVGLSFAGMPIVLPIMLGLFVALTLYAYLRGNLECDRCGRVVKGKQNACARCGPSEQISSSGESKTV